MSFLMTVQGFLIFLNKNIRLSHSLESLQETILTGSQNMIIWKYEENYPFIIIR